MASTLGEVPVKFMGNSWFMAEYRLQILLSYSSSVTGSAGGKDRSVATMSFMAVAVDWIGLAENGADVVDKTEI